MADQEQTRSYPSCSLCDKPDADACIRMIASSSGPGHSVYGHETCARDRGIIPLYLLTGAPLQTERAS